MCSPTTITSPEEVPLLTQLPPSATDAKDPPTKLKRQDAPPAEAPAPPRPFTLSKAARLGSGGLSALKTWYFFFFSAQITQLFLPLILSVDLSLSEPAIGLLMALRRLVVSLVAPLFTALCDASLRHYALLALALPAYFTCSALLPAVGGGFPAIAALLLLREALVAGCEPTVNAAAFAKLRQHHSGADSGEADRRFGEVRLWGSVGWGVAGLIVPALCDAIKPGSYLPVLYAHCMLGLPVVALVAFRYVDLSPGLFRANTRCIGSSDHAAGTPSKSDAGADERATATIPVASHDAPEGAATSSADTEAVTDADVLAAAPGRAATLASAVLLQGVVLGALQCTVLLYLAACGLRPASLGLSVTTGCFSEAALFFGHGRLRRVMSDARGMQIGMLGSVAMLCAYAAVGTLVPAPEGRVAARTALALAAECLNGGFYALFVCSAVSVAQAEAPPRWRTGAQGAVSAVLYGVGPAIGAAAGGVAMQAVGAPALYVALALANVVLSAVMQVFVLGGEQRRISEQASAGDFV